MTTCGEAAQLPLPRLPTKPWQAPGTEACRLLHVSKRVCCHRALFAPPSRSSCSANPRHRQSADSTTWASSLRLNATLRSGAHACWSEGTRSFSLNEVRSAGVQVSRSSLCERTTRVLLADIVTRRRSAQDVRNPKTPRIAARRNGSTTTPARRCLSKCAASLSQCDAQIGKFRATTARGLPRGGTS